MASHSLARKWEIAMLSSGERGIYESLMKKGGD